MTRILFALALLAGCGGSSNNDDTGASDECAAYCYVAHCAGQDWCGPVCDDAPATEYETVQCYEYIQINVAPSPVIPCACLSSEVRGQHPAECGQAIEQYGGRDYLRAVCLDD